MIKFEDVTFSFDGKLVINNFSEHIKAGEHVCLTGESGAGKSTLMKSIMGITLPVKGEIFINNTPINHNTVCNIRTSLAWVPQEIQLPYEYVKETIESPFSLKVNHNKKLDKDKMFQLFESLSLEKSIYDRRMPDITGGERQRLMIVLAILLETKLLLLAEPTSAIDSDTRNKMNDFLKNV